MPWVFQLSIVNAADCSILYREEGGLPPRAMIPVVKPAFSKFGKKKAASLDLPTSLGERSLLVELA